MWGERMSAKDTADWCRALATSLRSGIPVLKALDQAATRGAPAPRRVSAALAASLRAGEDVAGALAANRRFFPPLAVSMIRVGEESGRLPEVLGELEQYYRYQVSLFRLFVQQITWPAFQLGMAIGVVALVIYFLGMLPTEDILGLGLRGATGAFVWLAGWALLGALLTIAFWLARRKFGQAERIDRVLLALPVVGATLRTLAAARMSTALHLTLETGMSLRRAIPLALDASGNAAFAALSDAIVADIRAGRTLTESFSMHNIFPDELLDVLANAEEAGKVPEAMQQLSAEYSQRAQLQLALLNQAAGWLVWLIVAAILIFFIFQIAMKAYIGPIYNALDGKF